MDGRFGLQVLGLFLKVLVKQEHGESTSLRGGPNPKGSLHYGNFGTAISNKDQMENELGSWITVDMSVSAFLDHASTHYH